nr:peroxidase family protein [Methanobacterium formicicum]
MLRTLEDIQSKFNQAQSGNKKVSLADIIVLAGCAGVEQAAKKCWLPGKRTVHTGKNGRPGRRH